MGNILGYNKEITYCKNNDCITCYGDLEIRGKEAYSGGQKIHTFGEKETLKNKKREIPENLEKYEKEDTRFYFRKNRRVVSEPIDIDTSKNDDACRHDKDNEKYEENEEDESVTFSMPFVKVNVNNSKEEETVSVNVPFFSAATWTRKN